MPFISPCKARLRSCFLKGVDIQQYVHCLRVYENLNKPYLTAHLTILDNNNLFENLGIVGSEECSFTFDSPPNNKIYSQSVNLLSIKGHQSPNNLKTQIYEIDLIGKTFFQDKANLVQKSFGQMTGTDAISWVWSNFLNGDKSLKVLMNSIGMIGKQNDPSTIENLKPFAAIEQLKKYLTFSQYKTGVPMLFRDAQAVNLAPLQYLYDNMASQEFFLQKETWGGNFFDPLIYNSIIAAHPEIDSDTSEGGRSNVQDIAATVNQSQVVFDMFSGTLSTFKKGAQIGAGTFGSGKSIGQLISSIPSNLLSLGAGSLGGAPNIQVTQSNRWNRASAPDTKTMAERRYAAEAKGGPQLRIKVPMQSGINVTIGKGITAQLLPPTGDLTNANIFAYGMTGKWLVKELLHEVFTDDREVQATTSMALMRGGLGN